MIEIEDEFFDKYKEIYSSEAEEVEQSTLAYLESISKELKMILNYKFRRADAFGFIIYSLYKTSSILYGQAVIDHNINKYASYDRDRIKNTMLKKQNISGHSKGTIWEK